MKRRYDGYFKVDETDEDDASTRKLRQGIEVVGATDAVAVFVFHRTKGILLIEQERVPLVSESNPTGKLLEVVAGRFDRETTLVELITNELSEEAGIEIAQGGGVFPIIFPHREALATSPGMTSERIFLAYVEVEDIHLRGSDADTFGLAEEGERIKRRWLSVDEALSLQWQDLKSWALFQWFLRFKEGQLS